LAVAWYGWIEKTVTVVPINGITIPFLRRYHANSRTVI
jgi:hypothetical protein